MDLRSIVAAAAAVVLRGTVLRLVQQQGINSLEPLVDNLEQLARLEAMVASSKPPLRHGSRFGSRQYRGMFYGSRSRSGCLTGARLARHPLAFGRRAASTARSTPVIAYSLDLMDNPCIRTWRCLPVPPSLAPLSQEPLTNTDAQLVAEACGRAIQVLGLSRDELSAVVGKHRTSIDRTGLDPKTKAGELALLLLRAYRSLHSLFGGDHTLMRHWLEQPNHHLGEQPPRLLLFRIEGLNRVANYLDALRG